MAPRVRDYMSFPVLVVRPTDTLAYVRNLMIRSNIGRVVVVEGLRPVGIVTKHDFVKILADRRMARRPLDTITVEQIMARDPATIPDTASIKTAAETMLRHGISGLPVVDKDGMLVGIITRTDLARAYAERYPGKARVEDYMHVEVPTVGRMHTALYVAELLEMSEVGKVVVVEGGKPVGIITKSDLAFMDASLLAGRKPTFIKRVSMLEKGRTGAVRFYTVPLAGDVMTPDPITTRPDEDLAVAASTMVANNIGGLPVVDQDGRLVGLVSKLSILQALSKL